MNTDNALDDNGEAFIKDWKLMVATDGRKLYRSVR